MQEDERMFFFAKNTAELLYQLKAVAGLRVVGGCTLKGVECEKAISTRGIKELSQITRRERYIDLGPGVTLSSLLNVGERLLPRALYEAAASIGNAMTRNIATIGGNICAEGNRLTLFAPLLALDARLELKSQYDSRYVPLLGFSGIPKGRVLSNIRVPANEWNVSIFKRIGGDGAPGKNSASFAFLADVEKSAVANVKFAFAGPVTFRDVETENSVIGMRLPLSQKDALEIAGRASRKFSASPGFSECPPATLKKFENLLMFALESLM